MKTWLDLLALRFLTGGDGLPAFYKIAHVGLFSCYAYIIFHTVDGPSFSANLWPLLWWTALLAAFSLGYKGLTLWFSKASLTTTGSVNTQVSADLTKITEAIMKRRAESDHPGTEPSP